MWLLDTTTLTLSQQLDEDVVYAILSHRWGNDHEEVSFADIRDLKVARQKKGFRKLVRCCKQARTDGYDYAWIDTCCIDKSSSAELQEAINSMYRWYERSAVCYAFLEDVLPLRPIENSEWFTRGWTLQELLAPKVVHFFDKEWNFLGNQSALVEPIHDATRIPREILLKAVNIHDCCIAERMSWAAHRRTKRVEDRAYSLFGIFKVHLPMLYGEREAAFQRLQREILKTSEDDTLFAWTGVPEHYGGLLAPSLEAFRDGAVLTTRFDAPRMQIVSNATERSICITTTLTPWSTDTYLVLLGCTRQDGVDLYGVGIYLRTLDEDNSFARIQHRGVELQYIPLDKRYDLLQLGGLKLQTPYRQSRPSTWAMERSISVRQLPLLERHARYLTDRVYGFQYRDFTGGFTTHAFEFSRGIQPGGPGHGTWPEDIVWVTDGTPLRKGVVGAVKLHDRLFSSSVSPSTASPILDIHFGFDGLFNPVFYIRKTSTSAAKTTISPFLDEFSKGGRDASYQAHLNNTSDYVNSSTFSTLLPGNDKDLIEEPEFWNETCGEWDASADNSWQVVDRADRDFWAIKGDRKKSRQSYQLPNSCLWLGLTRIRTDDGQVWQLELHTL